MMQLLKTHFAVVGGGRGAGWGIFVIGVTGGT